MGEASGFLLTEKPFSAPITPPALNYSRGSSELAIFANACCQTNTKSIR